MIKICYTITKLEGGAQKVVLYTHENINQDVFDSFLVTGADGILNGETVKK
jgi:hypothetical protein